MKDTRTLRQRTLGSLIFLSRGLYAALHLGLIVAQGVYVLLKTFIDVDRHSDKEVIWQVGIHLAFVASAVFLAWIERMTTPAGAHRAKSEGGHAVVNG